ncbi:hypothetical protein Tco_1087249, partial [Tanacetum coccineum]
MVVAVVSWDGGHGGGGFSGGEEVEMARGSAWWWGSGRSGDGEHFWTWPEYSPEKFSGGGWPERWWRWNSPENGEREGDIYIC